MRILTGDECGLIKEVIPELLSSASSRHHPSQSKPTITTTASSSSVLQFQQQQQQFGSDGMTGIQRIGHVNNANANSMSKSAMDDDEFIVPGGVGSISMPGRAGGIVSLSFLPSNDDNEEDEESTSFQFAALRRNGIVETWKGSRRIRSGSGGGTRNNNNDERDESNVTPGLYTQCHVSQTSVLPPRSSSDDGGGGDSGGKEKAQNENNNNKSGWYMEQPIRPIGMVTISSSSSSLGTAGGGASMLSNNYNSTTTPLLATCDSIGTISLLSAHANGIGILARYNAFGLDTSNYNYSSSIPTATTTCTNNSKSNMVVFPHPSSSKNPSNSIGTLTYTKGQYANTHMATCFAIDTSGTKFAVGGRERSVVVLDVEYGNVIWKAKNLPPDPQTLLQQPMWTTALQFLHTPTTTTSSSSAWFSNIDDGDAGSSCEGNGGPHHNRTLLATGTAFKQVQIYDIRSSSSVSSLCRRPVLYTPEHLLEHRITSLCQLHDGYTLAVGDTVGDVHLLDMRKMHSGKQHYGSSSSSSSGGGGKHHGRGNGTTTAKEEIGKGRLVGPGGSIRQLYRHPKIPHYLGCVGYDRKLWMWNVTSRKMVECVYLKQRLNCLLICEDGSWNEEKIDDTMDEYGNNGHEDDAVVEEEDDEVEDYVDSDNNTDDDDDDDNDDESEKELESDVGIEEDDGRDGGSNAC